MTIPTVTASQISCALLLREEIALLDVRHEAAFATGHPLFTANMAADRIALEADTRLPRKDAPSWFMTPAKALLPRQPTG
jgi:rhodanese-related sulfurtransferase